MYRREVGLRTVVPAELTAIKLEYRKASQETREALAAENYQPEAVIAANWEIVQRLAETPFRVIGQKLTKGLPLSFQEAFLGMTFVVGATNQGIFQEIQPLLEKGHAIREVRQEQLQGPAQAFLTAMAQRAGTLTPEEVAGMVAGGLMDVVLRLGFSPHIVETGGMGGDRGFVIDGHKQKVINASTLSAITLSSLGVPVLKHGGHASTSALGSTETIEELGIHIYQQSFAEIAHLFEQTHFYFSGTQVAKTIHDLTHNPFARYETITHLIGPMTLPVDRETPLYKVFGINDSVDPAVVGKAYQLLHERGYQHVGNIVVVSGLQQSVPEQVNIADHAALKPYMLLDEASPYTTLLGVVQNGKYQGNFAVTPADFGTSLDLEGVLCPNQREALVAANRQALSRQSTQYHNYLAMNAAIGLFCSEYLSAPDVIKGNRLNPTYLHHAFKRCQEALASGQVEDHYRKIQQVSHHLQRT